MASDPATRAPGALGVLHDFVDTVDLEGGTDELTGPDELRAWLGSIGLVADDEPVTPTKRDVDAARTLRSALRTVLLAESGAEVAAAELAAAGREIARHSLRVSIDADGGPELVPVAGGVAGALARIVASIVPARADGTWERLKVCPADPCHWVFFDRSKNQSRTWCSMAVCGNRAKTQAYRARHGEH